MFISMILSVVMFVVTIPMKTVQLALKVKLKTDEKKSGEGSLRSKLGFKTKKEKKKKEKKKRKPTSYKVFDKAKRIATKAAIKALSALMLFMRVLSFIVSIVGAIISVIVATGGLALIAGAGAFLLLLSNSDFKLGIGITPVEAAEPDGQNFYAVLGESDGTIVTSVLLLGQYYVDYIADYDQHGYDNIPLLNGQSIRRDCTGFAQAVIQYTLGDSVSVPSMDSASLAKEDSGIAKFLLNNGFERHDIIAEGITPDMLQPGDMIIDRHIDPKDNKEKGHAEFIVDETHSFGWGDIQKKCPYGANIIKRDDGSLKLSTSDWHEYKVLWRLVKRNEE